MKSFKFYISSYVKSSILLHTYMYDCLRRLRNNNWRPNVKFWSLSRRHVEKIFYCNPQRHIKKIHSNMIVKSMLNKQLDDEQFLGVGVLHPHIFPKTASFQSCLKSFKIEKCSIWFCYLKVNISLLTLDTRTITVLIFSRW